MPLELPGGGTQPGNALALIIGRPTPEEALDDRASCWSELM